MLYSAYRPSLAPNAEPSHYDRGYSEDYQRHPYTHPSYAGPISTPAASTSMGASCDRFEYKGTCLIASLLESRLAGNNLVRDCSVIGVPQPGGVTVTSSPGQMPLAGTVPIAFVALSAPGRERSAQGGEKESKRMKTELLRWLVDFAPPFKQMKGKLMFVESIPRGTAGTVVRHLLVEKATSPPAPGPDKGYFNTVLSEPSTPAGPSRAASLADPSELGSPPKKTVRDSKRRATHSQIERRRREKINDRLVTLRSIVPACAKELEDRRRQKQEEEDEAARIAAGGAPKTYIDAATGKPKRKRNRKKPDSKKPTGGDKEEELGLHKLEVLTHAINYIFELKAHIHKLETGVIPEHVPTADNPFGVKNKDGTYRQDAKVEDEPGCGLGARLLGDEDAQSCVTKPPQSNVDRQGKDDDEEEEEEDQIEDEAGEGGRDGDDEEDDDEEDDDEPLERRSKKHMSSSAIHPHEDSVLPQPPTLSKPSMVAPVRYGRADTAYSSSSSRESAEVSPSFSLIQQSPSTISPATTVTSPMMSLSAESPILLPDPAISMSKRRVSQSPAFSALPTSAIPLPAARRESSSFLFKQLSLTSPNFAPYNPPSSAAARARSSTLSFPAYGEESEVRAQTTSTSTTTTVTPGLSDRADPTDANAAALLLNFSTSPEVLRPIGSRFTASVSSSPHTRPVAPLPASRSRSTFSSPQYRPLHSKPAATFSATTHAEIEEPEPLDLASPPHLALDSSPDANQDHEDADRLSDKTVEDPLPATAVKLEAAEPEEMDTAV